MLLKRLFRPSPAMADAPPAVPEGRRIYAIGDIHGRADLLDRLLAAIDVDDRASAPAATTIVFLGDLVDRGPDSRGVVERALALSQSKRDVRFIMGNHEEMFLAALDGREGAMRFFTRVGGQETILSYGITEAAYEAADYDGLVALTRAHVPPAHHAFIADFEPMVEIGDYLFVHAGLRPGVPLHAQQPSDLRWIRDAFLDDDGDHGRMVVHGHTIRPAVEIRANRIGIDTGAFASGRLTALRLEGSGRWLLDTADGGIAREI